ncbi:Carboxyvinyl-carboxyphosphonate phosphorylmutase, partial [Linum perenne]
MTMRFLETRQGPECLCLLITEPLVHKMGDRGFSISAARLGLSDAGFISYGEMVDQDQVCLLYFCRIFAHPRTCYEPMHIKIIALKLMNVLLKVSPKACGHTSSRKVVSREDAVMRIKAVVDAREESGSDIVIVARTDSRQAVSLDEALWRSRSFAQAGADVLFIDALASRDEMRAFCDVSSLVPKMDFPDIQHVVNCDMPFEIENYAHMIGRT